MAKKILLADDSITIQKVIELTFSDEDFEVVTVGNGRLAIERVQDVLPDIVLCDIIMPEKDGYEVCDFIKRNPATAHVPVLLLTGAFEPFDQDRATRVGCDGYLAKPFEPQSLIAKVKDLLNQSAGRSRGAAAPAVVTPPPVPMAAQAPAAPVFSPPPPPPPPVPPRAAYTAPAPAYFEDEDAAVLDTVEDAAEEGVAAEAPISDAERDSLAGDEPLPFEDEPAPWAQPTVEVPLETRARAAVEAQQQAAASEPVFEEMFDEAEPAEPEPMAAATEPAPVDEGFGFVRTSDIAGSPASPSVPSADLPPTVREGFGWARDEDVAGAAEPVPPPLAIEEEEPEAQTTIEDEDFGFVRTQDLSGAPRAPSAPAPAVPETVREGFGWAREADLGSATIPGGSAAAREAAAQALAPEAERFAEIAENLVSDTPPPPPAPAAPLASPATPGWPPAPVQEPPVPAPDASFSEIAPPSGADGSAVPSGAAEVAVPMDMVETIAQRVVAQISEKVIREIAWEVIPELAETLIRREIERLKAESERS